MATWKLQGIRAGPSAVEDQAYQTQRRGNVLRQQELTYQRGSAAFERETEAPTGTVQEYYARPQTWTQDVPEQMEKSAIRLAAQPYAQMKLRRARALIRTSKSDPEMLKAARAAAQQWQDVVSGSRALRDDDLQAIRSSAQWPRYVARAALLLPQHVQGDSRFRDLTLTTELPETSQQYRAIQEGRAADIMARSLGGTGGPKEARRVHDMLFAEDNWDFTLDDAARAGEKRPWVHNLVGIKVKPLDLWQAMTRQNPAWQTNYVTAIKPRGPFPLPAAAVQAGERPRGYGTTPRATPARRPAPAPKKRGRVGPVSALAAAVPLAIAAAPVALPLAVGYGVYKGATAATKELGRRLQRKWGWK